MLLVDGGVGVTGNPVYQACVEAFYYDNFTPVETSIVSLGTGSFPMQGNFCVIVTSNARLRVRLYGDVNAWRRRLLIVRYEDLRRDTETGLLEMLDFLGINGDRDLVRRAVENNSLRAMREKEDRAKKSGATLGKGTLLRKHRLDREDARFVRSGSVGGWREKLSDTQIDMVTRYASQALVRAGYPSGLSMDAQPEELASEVQA